MNKTMKHLALLTVASLPLIQGCESSAAWEGTVTDSAGVAIVSNTATPMWQPGDGWTVTEDLRIGTVAGEPEYQFGTVTGLDVATDGTVYVLDMQAMEIRAFDPQGSYLRTLGNPGAGPGELSQQALGVFIDPTGEIRVIDMGNARVNRYNSSGEPAGSFRVDISNGIPTVWKMSNDGRFMAQIKGTNLPGMAALAEGDPIVIYDTTGVVVDTLTVLPKGQMIEELSEERLSIRIFAPEPLWDLGTDGTVFKAMNDRYQIQVTGLDGTLQRIIRREVERKPVEESDKEAILRAIRQQYQEFGVPPQAIEQIIQGMGFADYYPAFGQMFVDPEGSLWVQRIRSAKDMAAGAEGEVEFDAQAIGSPEWEIFDPEGRYMGVVALPERFRPLKAVGNEIYGVWNDELDVEYVMRLAVTKPAM